MGAPAPVDVEDQVIMRSAHWGMGDPVRSCGCAGGGDALEGSCALEIDGSFAESEASGVEVSACSITYRSSYREATDFQHRHGSYTERQVSAA